MKILLNGATGGTNFGDFLFTKIFHDKVVSLIGEKNVFWYDSKYCLSDFYKKHLKCNPRRHKISDINALVCISGGYFCGNDKTVRDYIIRYFRYFHLCIRCVLNKIPIAIIGLEVAKSQSKIIDKIQKIILQRAAIVVVRNVESLEQLKKYGVTNAVCTADTAHVITPSMFENCEIQNDIEQLKGKKLFFHVQPSCIDAAKRLIPVVNQFVAVHPEYSIVIGTDQYCSDERFLNELAGAFSCPNVIVNHYDYPMTLCKVLNAMDFIITPKLHVGIVGATFSKSVVSFSVHSEKISRFYRHLDEEDRSLPMENFSEEKALELLEKYHDLPIFMNPHILELSQKNLQYLEDFVDTIIERLAEKP